MDFCWFYLVVLLVHSQCTGRFFLILSVLFVLVGGELHIR